MLRLFVTAASVAAAAGDSNADVLPHGRRLHLGKSHLPVHRDASLVGLKIAAVPASNQKIKIASHQLTVKPGQAEAVDTTVASHLQSELAELKQRRSHIKQLEEALKADAGLLHESVTLERMSKTKRGHTLAEHQVKEATEVVKATEQMLHESKANAVEMSTEMLRESEAVRNATDELATEATQQLKVFKGSAPAETTTTTGVQVPTTTAKVTTVPAKSKAPDSDEDLDDIEDEN